MKKILIAGIVSLTITTSVMAADTYTGAFFEAQQKKIDAQTSKVVNKERQFNQQIQAQQQNATTLNQQPSIVEKKKQQIQAQKDAFNQQKKELKSLFSVN